MYKMMKSGKSRFFLTSIVRNYFPSVTYAPSRRLLCTTPYDDDYDIDSTYGRPFPRFVERDLFDRPLPSEKILSLIETLEHLTIKEKHEFRFIFSEALGLPTPPKTPRRADQRFLVKLMECEKPYYNGVLKEVAWAQTTEEKTSLYQFYMGDSYEIAENVPSIVKQYITKEEAEDLAAKLNAAGGVAVVEEVDGEEEKEKEKEE